MRRGVLVVLEGIDGAGTTTQTARLAEALRGDGYRVHETREPSDGPVGLLLRAMLGGEHAPPHAPIDATTMSLLFAADRADHIHREVEPELAAGAVVVSDRWYHSSLAYQGDREERTWIRELNRRALRPDLTVFLRVAPGVAAARRDAAGRSDEIYDALDKQRRVAAGYEAVMAALAAEEPVAIVDGEAPEAEVAREIAALARETCATRGVPPRSEE